MESETIQAPQCEVRKVSKGEQVITGMFFAIISKVRISFKRCTEALVLLIPSFVLSSSIFDFANNNGSGLFSFSLISGAVFVSVVRSLLKLQFGIPFERVDDEAYRDRKE